MRVSSPPIVGGPADDPALLGALADAGLPTTGRFTLKAGWASRAWVGNDYVVRLGDGRSRDAYRHEARVVDLLAGSDVPHARHVAHGDGPDGSWYVSERLAGQTLQEAWPTADAQTRRSMIESLGLALRALHHVSVPDGLLPPWLAAAHAGAPWPAYHPPVVAAALPLVEDAQRRPDLNSDLLADTADWIRKRLSLFADDRPVLVHGDLHGSNVIVDHGRVTGLIDFAEALAQPADVELDTILHWSANAHAYPPEPGGRTLDATALEGLPGWLRGAYPELFEPADLRERLRFYDLNRELAIYAPSPRDSCSQKPRGSASGACSPAITIWMNSSGRPPSPLLRSSCSPSLTSQVLGRDQSVAKGRDRHRPSVPTRSRLRGRAPR